MKHPQLAYPVSPIVAQARAERELSQHRLATAVENYGEPVRRMRDANNITPRIRAMIVAKFKQEGDTSRGS